MMTQEFLRRIERDNNLRIAVAGDCMVDRYVPIRSDRVSPEFPIPVMTRDHKKPIISMPGGAGNVALQMSHFPVKVYLHTICDQETAEVLTDHKIPFLYTSIILEQRTGANARKVRYYSDNFPISRFDDDPDLENTFLPKPNFGDLSQYSALILSDYDKGFFFPDQNPEQWIGKCPITIVDPKRNPIERWRNCTVFKPNYQEAVCLSGKNEWQDQCNFFLKAVDCDHVVITHGGDGVVGKSRDGSHFEYRPARQTVARSVIGAGDCFIAFLAMAMSTGLSIDAASEVAFEAGSTYVQNLHNRPVMPSQLVGDASQRKMIDPPKNRDFTLGFTNGCFDLIHSGHLETLRFAKSKCDKLVVAVNSDESVRRLKGSSRPIMTLKDRMNLLANLSMVDYVVSFDDDTPIKLIRKYKPDIVVKGGDYQAEDVVGNTECKVLIAPLVPNYSTSSIVEKINAREC